MLKFRQWWVNHLNYLQSYVTVVYFIFSFMTVGFLIGYMTGNISLFPVLISGCIALASLCFDAYICTVQSWERLRGKK